MLVVSTTVAMAAPGTRLSWNDESGSLCRNNYYIKTPDKMTDAALYDILSARRLWNAP